MVIERLLVATEFLFTQILNVRSDILRILIRTKGKFAPRYLFVCKENWKLLVGMYIGNNEVIESVAGQIIHTQRLNHLHLLRHKWSTLISLLFYHLDYLASFCRTGSA